MLGIKNLKNAISTLIKVGEEVDQSLADDGKISIWEGGQIGFKAIGFVKVFKSIGEIKAEYLDLDDEEKEELKNYVAEEFDIENDDIEEKIEQVFNLLIELNEVLVSFNQ